MTILQHSLYHKLNLEIGILMMGFAQQSSGWSYSLIHTYICSVKIFLSHLKQRKSNIFADKELN